MSFMAGTSLETVAKDCQRYSANMNELGIPIARDNLKFLWQTVLNLMGNPDDPCKLEGKIIPDFDKYKSSVKVPMLKNTIYFNRLFVCTLFGQYEQCHELMIEDNGEYIRAGAGFSLCVFVNFLTALSMVRLARKTKKRKHKREAKRLLNIISGWAKKDNPNVLHQHNLLLAEFRSMEGKLDEAELLYTRAFRLASRSGFRHEAAMINELTAEFFRDQKKSLDDAKYKMEEACKLYEEWGCQIKADMLRREYKVLSEQPIDVVVKVE